MSIVPSILFIAAVLITAISTVWLVVLAFQKHVGWGFAVLLLPFASLVYTVVDWGRACRPFFWQVTAGVLFVLGYFSLAPKDRPWVAFTSDTMPATAVASGPADAASSASSDGSGGALSWSAMRDSIAGSIASIVPGNSRSDEASSRPVVPPHQKFSSHLPPRPEGLTGKHEAQPGVFYLVERVRVTSSTGIKAANPGEEVRLIERLPGGKLRVTVGRADFIVSQTQVTDDLDRAREVEKRDFMERGGEL